MCIRDSNIAESTVVDLDSGGEYSGPIVTEIVDLKEFYRAEDYHQEYYRNNSTQPYCQVVISPKLSKFRQKYVKRIKADA